MYVASVAIGLLVVLFFTQNFSNLEFDGIQLKKNQKLVSCAQPLRPEPGTFTMTRDIVYTKRISRVANEEQTFNFSRPKDILLRPLAIVVHGGGWQNGSKDEGGVVSVSAYLVRQGFAVANFNYPLVKTVDGVSLNQFPIPIQALRCGMRYLNKNAAALGIDKTRVVTYGASAGGNLSTMLAYAGDDTSGVLDSPECEHKLQPLLPVHASISNSGVYAFRVVTAFDRPGARAYLGRPECNPDVNTVETVACRDYRWAQAALASPRQYIDASTPPSFIIHSYEDGTVNYDQFQWLTRTLKEHGVPFKGISIDGREHVLDIFNYNNLQTRSTMCQMFDFLESVIGKLPSF